MWTWRCPGSNLDEEGICGYGYSRVVIWRGVQDMFSVPKEWFRGHDLEIMEGILIGRFLCSGGFSNLEVMGKDEVI